MSDRCDVAIVGSGFAGSLMARVLATLGYDVVLLERGTHPRFAIGESSTPLANLSLERLARRYGLADCYHLAAYGRWMEHYPELRRGLKRGFTFYRHHPGASADAATLAAERLLVAASPSDAIADTHWLRADVDHHFVRAAIAAGVDYRDRTHLAAAEFTNDGVDLIGGRAGSALHLRAAFVIDASGPGGFLAQQLSIPSGLSRTLTRSAILFGHFAGVRPVTEVFPSFEDGPYPDDRAAVHHIIDEGWMYSLRFDHDVTSAGFLLRANVGGGREPIGLGEPPDASWRRLLDRYPAIAALFENANPLFPLAFRSIIQHRLTRASGPRWALMPHAYAFVDPLFSTGIAWSLRAVERLALAFEAAGGSRIPAAATLERYDAMLAAEADQIDRLVAAAYDSMAHFDLMAAHAMIYFATVSYAEVRQRVLGDAERDAWGGFLGVGDSVLERLPVEALLRLRRITHHRGDSGSAEDRRQFMNWVRDAIAPRNIGGFADPTRHNRYPVDLDVLIERHGLLGMTREQLIAALPGLRGMATDQDEQWSAMVATEHTEHTERTESH